MLVDQITDNCIIGSKEFNTALDQYGYQQMILHWINLRMPADVMCVCFLLNGHIVKHRHSWDNESHYCPELLQIINQKSIDIPGPVFRSANIESSL